MPGVREAHTFCSICKSYVYAQIICWGLPLVSVGLVAYFRWMGLAQDTGGWCWVKHANVRTGTWLEVTCCRRMNSWVRMRLHACLNAVDNTRWQKSLLLENFWAGIGRGQVSWDSVHHGGLPAVLCPYAAKVLFLSPPISLRSLERVHLQTTKHPCGSSSPAIAAKS